MNDTPDVNVSMLYGVSLSMQLFNALHREMQSTETIYGNYTIGLKLSIFRNLRIIF